MLRSLNKIAGSFAGAILYPLKSLIISFLLIALTPLAAVAALFILPIAVFILVGITNGLRAGIKAALFFLAAVVVVSFLVLCGLVGLAIRDLFSAVLLGITDGYKNGLFFHVLKHAVFDVLVFSTILRHVTMSLNQQSQVGGPDAAVVDSHVLLYLMLSQNGFLEPVPRSPNDVTGLSGVQDKMEFTPLTADELSLAGRLPEIEESLRSYNALIGRLDKLDEAMEKRTSSTEELDDKLIEDELVAYMSITNPVLLVQQYKYQPPQLEGEEPKPAIWLTVPLSSHITEKDNVQKWFEQSARHPLRGDSFNVPNQYKGQQTRYKYFDYQGKDSALELVEASNLIREALKQQLNPGNINPAAVYHNVTALLRNNSLFGSADAAQPDTRPDAENSYSYI